MSILHDAPAQPVNAFDPEFLADLEEMDTLETTLEAELAGPWKIHRVDGEFGLYRLWESPEAGSAPEAVFGEMSDALRFLAATLPAGRESAIRIEERREGCGFPVWSYGTRIGQLRWSSEPLVQSLHAVEHLSRSPYYLTALIVAAGPQVIREVGKMLRQGVPAWRSGSLGIFGQP
jgi:hypothetical protein